MKHGYNKDTETLTLRPEEQSICCAGCGERPQMKGRSLCRDCVERLEYLLKEIHKHYVAEYTLNEKRIVYSSNIRERVKKMVYDAGFGHLY